MAWDSETEPAVASLRIYYGTLSRHVSGTYEHSKDIGMGTQISNDTTTFTLTGLTKGQTYYIAVTAHDKSGVGSDLSSEVSGQAK